MKVFIEQAGEPNIKNVFNKETKAFVEAKAFHLTYPYPYGYILDTRAPDGDELDCYIITNKKLQALSVVECEPIGMTEWFEDGEEDHKILMVLKDEEKSLTASGPLPFLKGEEIPPAHYGSSSASASETSSSRGRFRPLGKGENRQDPSQAQDDRGRKGEQVEVTEEVKAKIEEFAAHFFDDVRDKDYLSGEYKGKEAAEALIAKSQEAYRNR